MQKQKFILMNETHKTLWDFEIQKDQLKSPRRPKNLVIIIKKRKLAAKYILLSHPTTD